MLKFDEDLGTYTLELDGILFSWYEEPTGDYEQKAKIYADNYYNNLSGIVEFMSGDIQEMYGECSADEIKARLGQPIIDFENGEVTYCEQTFDGIHIFSFEFLDEEFKELQYFSVDG